MAKSNNGVHLIGRLTKDPELNYTKEKKVSVVQFILAVKENYKKKDGTQGANFPYCVVYGKSAEFMRKYLKKGDLISIDGEIRTRTYDNRDGQHIFHTEILCKGLMPLESKAVREERNNIPEPEIEIQLPEAEEINEELLDEEIEC